MSYEKARRHSIRKSRKQANNHFGFDTGSRWPNVRRSAYMEAILEIRQWFASRHDGNKQYNRECIREAIERCRVAATEFDHSQLGMDCDKACA
ncbi:hypothetical protein D3C87_616500 [compost metagenome]